MGQCEPYLRKNFPKAKITSVGSTAQALSLSATLSQKDKIVAAIGPTDSAAQYGLKILAKEIAAMPNNHTRFVVLSKEDGSRSGDDKTSIVFTIRKDKPGGLYGVLGEFASREINLTKIESRPAKKDLGEYYFFIDLQGHKTERRIAEALKAVAKKASLFKILGSYPRGALAR